MGPACWRHNRRTAVIMTCIYATETDKKSFSDLTPNKWEVTHFVCKCGFNECRCPSRIPPNTRPFDSAGIHSHTRFNPDGTEKTDYIIVKRRYCCLHCCSNYIGDDLEKRDYESSSIRDL